MKSRFIILPLFLGLVMSLSPTTPSHEVISQMGKVYVLKSSERIKGLEALFLAIKLPALESKTVLIKPNFNSDDPFPATTHLDTLEFVIKKLKAKNPTSITIAERSGMGETAEVLKNRGVYKLAKKYGVKVINLDRVSPESWVRIDKKGTHWGRGYLVAKVFLEADYIINLPCLKTHRFGGDFTLALKNNVGAIAKWDPHGFYNYMWELHGSKNQRLMIAEINKEVPTHLIILDAMEGFSTEGPDKGKPIEPQLFLASSDRVAIDVVGVAVLRLFGTTPKVSKGKIFDLDQIRRAAELGIGATSPQKIELISITKESEEIVSRIQKELLK